MLSSGEPQCACVRRRSRCRPAVFENSMGFHTKHLAAAVAAPLPAQFKADDQHPAKTTKPSQNFQGVLAFVVIFVITAAAKAYFDLEAAEKSNFLDKAIKSVDRNFGTNNTCEVLLSLRQTNRYDSEFVCYILKHGRLVIFTNSYGMAVTERDVNVIKNQEKMCSLERQTSIKAGLPLSSFYKEHKDSIAVVEDEVKDITVNFKPEDLYYDMSGEKILLIFNHYMFKATKYHRYSKPKERIGTNQDVKALKDVFGSIGFKVMTYNDYDHEEIIGTMAKISRLDHSRTSCLAVAILTHGDKGGELHAADRPYLLEDITVLLENGHPTLVNKPKLFFIQACRGALADAGRTLQYDGFDQNNLVVPTHSDFLFLYSTVEDHVSWRDIGGSWLIQELCKVIQQYHKDFDLLYLITITMRNVAYSYSSYTPRNRSMHNKKQCPEARLTLTKLVKF